MHRRTDIRHRQVKHIKSPVDHKIGSIDITASHCKDAMSEQHIYIWSHLNDKRWSI